PHMAEEGRFGKIVDTRALVGGQGDEVRRKGLDFGAAKAASLEKLDLAVQFHLIDGVARPPPADARTCRLVRALETLLQGRLGCGRSFATQSEERCANQRRQTNSAPHASPRILPAQPYGNWQPASIIARTRMITPQVLAKTGSSGE